MIYASNDLWEEHEGVLAGLSILERMGEAGNANIFPMGDRMIPQEEQQRLLSAFKQHEESVMGPGVHEHLHEVLHRLSENSS